MSADVGNAKAGSPLPLWEVRRQKARYRWALITTAVVLVLLGGTLTYLAVSHPSGASTTNAVSGNGTHPSSPAGSSATSAFPYAFLLFLVLVVAALISAGIMARVRREFQRTQGNNGPLAMPESLPSTPLALSTTEEDPLDHLL